MHVSIDSSPEGRYRRFCNEGTNTFKFLEINSG